MQGIVKGAMKGNPAQQEQSSQQMPGEEQEQGTAQEQDGYERTMLAFETMLYDQEVAMGIVKRLELAGDDAPKAIATLSINMLIQLDEKAKGKIPSQALIEVAIGGVERIAELGEKAGLFEFDEPMQALTIQQLVAIAIERGLIDPSEIEELIGSMDPQEVQSMVAQQQQMFGGAA